MRTPAASPETTPAYLEAMRAQAAAGRPWTATVEVTNRCNLACAHCYVVDGRLRKSSAPELTPLEMSSALDQLRGLGVFTLTFTGGEFFAHPSRFDYLEMATSRAFAVRIFSNLAAAPPPELERLLDYNVFAVETSIHGADAAAHDRFTGVAGSFDRTVASVKILRRLRIPVVAKVCWTRHNWRRSREILRLCARLGAGFRGTCFIQPRSDGSTDNLYVRLSDEELRELAGKAGGGDARPRDPGADDRPVCGAGRTSLRIDPYGGVYPCVDITVAAGSLRERPLAEIWTDSEVMKKVRAVRRRDFVFNGPRVECMLCMGANLRERGDMLLVAEEARRIARALGPGTPEGERNENRCS